jgi:TonB family protein
VNHANDLVNRRSLAAIIISAIWASALPVSGQEKNLRTTTEPNVSQVRAQPLSQYCDKVKARLRLNWSNDKSLGDPVDVDFSVDPAGKIYDVSCSGQVADSVQECAKQRLMAIGNLDPPPSVGEKPLQMHVHFCNDPARMTVTTAVDFKEYMSWLQHAIKQEWRPPRADESKRVVARFKIWRDGHFSDTMLTRSTGSVEGDQAALEAIHKIASSQALPDGSPEFVEIEFTFDYNVFRRNGSMPPFRPRFSDPPIRPYASKPTVRPYSSELGLPVVTAEGLSDSAYFAMLQDRINRKFYPPPWRTWSQLSISLKLDRNGRVCDLKIVDSSKDGMVDSAVLQAVRLAAPFDPLPTGAGEKVEFRLRFR